MSRHELDKRVQDWRELRRMAEEIAAEMDAIADAIKSEMTAQGVEELAGTYWRATWKEVTTSRLDTKAIKKANPLLCEMFTKQTTTRRFCIA